MSHGVLPLITFISYIVSSFPFLFGVHSVLWRFRRRHVSEQTSFLKSTGQCAKIWPNNCYSSNKWPWKDKRQGIWSNKGVWLLRKPWRRGCFISFFKRFSCRTSIHCSIEMRSTSQTTTHFLPPLPQCTYKPKEIN